MLTVWRDYIKFSTLRTAYTVLNMKLMGDRSSGWNGGQSRHVRHINTDKTKLRPWAHYASTQKAVSSTTLTLQFYCLQSYKSAAINIVVLFRFKKNLLQWHSVHVKFCQTWPQSSQCRHVFNCCLDNTSYMHCIVRLYLYQISVYSLPTAINWNIHRIFTDVLLFLQNELFYTNIPCVTVWYFSKMYFHVIVSGSYSRWL